MIAPLKIGTIVVALFGIVAAHRLAYSRERKSRLAAAAATFRNAFAPELAVLKSPHTETDGRTLLLDAFSRHSQAAEVFQHHLGWLGKRRFIRAWNRLHSAHNFPASEFRIPKKDQIFLDFITSSEKIDSVSLALKKIDSLIKHAKQT